MAALDTTRTTFGSAPVANRLGRALTSVFATVAAWNDARVTRNALNKLSDRELADIGLSRGDIDTVAKHTV